MEPISLLPEIRGQKSESEIKSQKESMERGAWSRTRGQFAIRISQLNLLPALSALPLAVF